MSEELDELLEALSADEYWRREEAIRRLTSEAPAEGLVAQLTAALADDAHAERRNAARSALAALASGRASDPAAVIDALAELLASAADPDVRLLSATALGESENPAARPPLEHALADEDTNVAASAADALGVLGDTRSVPALTEALRSDSFWLDAAVVAALGAIGGADAREALANAAADPELAGMVAAALGEIGAAEGLDLLEHVLSGAPAAREAVLEGAAAILAANPGLRPPEWLRSAAGEAADELLARATDPIDLQSARLLGILGSEAAADRLVRALCAPGADDSAMVGIGLLPRSLAAPLLLRRLGGAHSESEKLRLLEATPAIGDAAAAHEIAEFLGDPSRAVRSAAAEALGRSDPQVVLPILFAVARDPNRRRWGVRALSRMPATGPEPLQPYLEDPDPAVRAAAAEGIARCGHAEAGRLAVALRRETDPETRVAMARALGIAGGSEAARELAGLVTASDDSLRFAAVEALGRTGAAEAFPPLLAALTDRRPELQAAALYALGELGDPRGSGPVAERLASGSRDLRRTAAVALDHLAPPDALDRLNAALADSDREVRLTAVRLLERIAGEASLERLDRAADRDEDPLVRRAACEAADTIRRVAKDG